MVVNFVIKLYILLAVHMVFSEINIRLKLEKSSIYIGDIVRPINDNEAYEWNLLPIEKCETFVESSLMPTPQGCYLSPPEKFKHYLTDIGLESVQSMYKPRKVKLVRKINQTLLTDHQTFVNRSPYNTTLSVKMKGNVLVQDTTRHSMDWGKSDGVKGCSKMSVVGALEASSDYKWGSNKTYSKSKTTELHELVVPVPSNKVLNVYFYIIQVKAKFEIEYENTLLGHIFVDFNPPVKGHHFHFIPISKWVNTTRTFTDTVKVTTVSGSKILASYSDIHEDDIILQPDRHLNAKQKRSNSHMEWFEISYDPNTDTTTMRKIN